MTFVKPLKSRFNTTIVEDSNQQLGVDPEIVGGGGAAPEFTEDPAIKVLNFTALNNYSYTISSTEGVAKMVTLPGAPADKDKVRIRDYGGGTDTLSINPNGHGIIWADTVTGTSFIRTFTGIGFDITFEFRSIAEGGDDRWQARGSETIQFFGNNPVPQPNSVILTDSNGFAAAIEASTDQWVGNLGGVMGAHDISEIGGYIKHGSNLGPGSHTIGLGFIHYMVSGPQSLSLDIPDFSVLANAPHFAIQWSETSYDVTITLPPSTQIQDPKSGLLTSAPLTINGGSGDYFEWVGQDDGEGGCLLHLVSQVIPLEVLTAGPVVQLVSADQTLAPNHIYVVDSSVGVRTLTLPLAADAQGFGTITVKRVGANSVVIETDGFDTIDGASNLTLGVHYEWAILVTADGAEWSQIG